VEGFAELPPSLALLARDVHESDDEHRIRVGKLLRRAKDVLFLDGLSPTLWREWRAFQKALEKHLSGTIPFRDAGY
jgi:hypothetical protein